MDFRLSRRTDKHGEIWQICELCTEWTSYENLAIDPADGLRWDVCKDCKEKEND